MLTISITQPAFADVTFAHPPRLPLRIRSRISTLLRMRTLVTLMCGSGSSLDSMHTSRLTIPRKSPRPPYPRPQPLPRLLHRMTAQPPSTAPSLRIPPRTSAYGRLPRLHPPNRNISPRTLPQQQPRRDRTATTTTRAQHRHSHSSRLQPCRGHRCCMRRTGTSG